MESDELIENTFTHPVPGNINLSIQPLPASRGFALFWLNQGY
jgi:hypothetical protein